MADVLITHSYHLPYDPKQVRKMQPYPPLGTLYAASALKAGNISVAVFDTNPRAPARMEARTSSLLAVPEITVIGVPGNVAARFAIFCSRHLALAALTAASC